jgi:hypothetical protein
MRLLSGTVESGVKSRRSVARTSVSLALRENPGLKHRGWDLAASAAQSILRPSALVPAGMPQQARRIDSRPVECVRAEDDRSAPGHWRG